MDGGMYKIREIPNPPTQEELQNRIDFLREKVSILKEAMRNPSTANKQKAFDIWDMEE